MIPARGGSKRIPKKNIKDFAGRPIISYSIATAIGSRIFDNVIVSTDDEEIATIAREFGASVPFMRPAFLSDDHCGIHEVMGHAVETLQSQGNEIQQACCIFATAPFIREIDLAEGLKILNGGRFSSVVGASKFSSPVFRSFSRLSEGGIDMLFPEHYTSRSQDLPEVFHDAGQFAWGSSTRWLAPASGFDSDTTFVELPRERVQDIDDPDDWEIAEAMYKLLELNRSSDNLS